MVPLRKISIKYYIPEAYVKTDLVHIDKSTFNENSRFLIALLYNFSIIKFIENEVGQFRQHIDDIYVYCVVVGVYVKLDSLVFVYGCPYNLLSS